MIRPIHPWDVTPAEARAIQMQLRRRVVRSDRLAKKIRCVAGADCAFDLVRGVAYAGVIVYSFPDMVELERVSASWPLRFPYVPGLLTFREAPALLAAFEKVKNQPDVLFVDGHGYAHPRRFGIASHLGVLLETPTVGCAKSRLIGIHAEPGIQAGTSVPLLDKGETIGAVLRTRSGVKPIYVSTGHCVSLRRALRLVRAVCDGFRIPKPTREADRYVGAVKRKEVGE